MGSWRGKKQRIKLLKKLVERDGGLRCFYCRLSWPHVNLDTDDISYITIDHIDRDQGNQLDNLRIACFPCNHVKEKHGDDPDIKIERYGKHGRRVRVIK